MRRRGPAQFAPGANVAACNYFSREQVRPSHSLWSWELGTASHPHPTKQILKLGITAQSLVSRHATHPFPVLRSRHVGIRGPARPRESGETGKPPYAPTRSCPQSPWWTRMGALTSRYLVPVISMASRKWTRTSDSRLGRQADVRPSCVLCRNTVPGCKDPA